MSELNVNIAVMDQLGPEALAESPLHHVQLPALASRAHQRGGVVFRELALMGHLVLRGNQSNPSLAAAVSQVLGVELPATPMSHASAGQYCICWVSPDEWLVLVPGEEAFAIEEALRAALQGHFAIINVSGGQTLFELSGPDAVNVLKKSMVYDMHPSHFPVGKCITSTFAKTQTLIRRTADDCFVMTIRRSFADYAWLWIQDASMEYGLVVAA